MTDDVPVPITKERNYSSVNETAQIFLLENIGIKEMAEVAPELIALASLMVNDQGNEQTAQSGKVRNIFKRRRNPGAQGNNIKINSPYDITCADFPLLDFYINGYGMSYNAYNQIASAISLAKSRGVIIRTTVTGLAAGIASLVAAMGTPGFRVMYAGAQHYMTVPQPIVANVYNQPVLGFKAGASDEYKFNELSQWGVDAYKNNTKLTPEQIDSVSKEQNGFMDSEFCLNHGVCDWVLMNDGKLICADALKNSNQR